MKAIATTAVSSPLLLPSSSFNIQFFSPLLTHDMSGALNKRQQARNENALQELLHSTPGNNLCADCQARNPGWASWSLGIFLCMRCAAIHRKLGTHVSKVKSLSMDSWSVEQVENMRKVGNVISNRNYNPQNKKPPMPIDSDEADSVIERFIRQKYMTNALARQSAGNHEPPDEKPPLPPKTLGRFGFRSASSILSLGSRMKDAARETTPATHRSVRSPHQRNKPSQVFGTSVTYDTDEDRRMERICELGLHPTGNRNASIPRSLNVFDQVSRGGRLPISPSTSLSELASKPSPPMTPSSNPFDSLDVPVAQPQSTQSTGTLQNRNPFGLMTYHSTSQALDQTFQGLPLTPQPQPNLFPHHTGGIPTPQHSYNPFYVPPMTPPMPSLPQAYGPNGNTYPQLVTQHSTAIKPQPTGYNPFLSNNAPVASPTSLVGPSSQPQAGSNPFFRSASAGHPSILTQIPEQWPQQQQPTLPEQSGATNPFMAQQLGMSYRQIATQQQQPQQPQVWSRPPHPDKESIMALYSLPPPVRAPLAPQDQNVVPARPTDLQQQPSIPTNPSIAMNDLAGVSGTIPAKGNNPFASQVSSRVDVQPSLQLAVPNIGGASNHSTSREGMMAYSLDWLSGRHSPDAFSGLSARDMR